VDEVARVKILVNVDINHLHGLLIYDVPKEYIYESFWIHRSTIGMKPSWNCGRKTHARQVPTQSS